MRQAFITDKAARPTNPYSHGVIASGKTLWISGQVPVDPATGALVEGDFGAQATRVFENVKLIAEAAGASLALAVKVNVYLRNNDDFAAMNEIYKRYFPEPRAARTTVQSDLRNTPIEVDCVVALENETVTLGPVRRRAIVQMQSTLATVRNLAGLMTDSEASTLRDGPDGWTPLEIVGHLLDADLIFRQRVELMLAGGFPLLPAFDGERLVRERQHNSKRLENVVADLGSTRMMLAGLFGQLTSAQWECAGLHPTSGTWSLTDSAQQVSLHDNEHLAQISRILAEARAK